MEAFIEVSKILGIIGSILILEFRINKLSY